MIKTTNTIAEIMLAKGDLLEIPISGTFELNPTCNMNCKMCYVKESYELVQKRGGLLPKEDWLQLADQAMAQGCLFILLTGGEPLLHPDFIDIYRELARRGVFIGINTNGTMMTEEHFQLFDQYRPRRINVSLYGASPETYGRLCGYEAGYEKAVACIERLHSMNLNLCIHVTVTPENKDDLEAIFNFAGQLDIPVEASSYMFPALRRTCGQSVDFRFSPEEAAGQTICINRLLCEEENFSLDIESYECAKYDESLSCDYSRVLCRAGSSVFWLTWDGKLAPCGMMSEPQYDILNTSFAEGWTKIHNEMKNLRLSQTCTQCEDRPFCTVCAAKAYAETGSFQGTPKYLCEMTRHVRRLLRVEEEQRKRRNDNENK